MLDGLAENLSRTRLLDIGYYHALRHWEAMLRGDLIAARAHGDTSESLKDSIGIPFVASLFFTARADLCVEEGRYADARRHLAKARAIAVATRSRLVEFTVGLGEAYAALRSGDEALMRQRLEDALAIGRERGLISFLGSRAQPMAELCARALESDIESRYVIELIRRRALAPPSWAQSLEVWPWPVRLHTLGRFAVELNGRPAPSLGKLARKPLDLLKHLVSGGPRGVSSTQASEALWPDQDPEHSYHAYGMALHRLRKMLGSEDSILSRDGGIVLNPQHVFVDAWAFERSLDALDESGHPQFERVLALYKGLFLGAGGAEDPWTLGYGERLFSRYLRAALRAGQHWQQKGDFDRAIDLYLNALHHDDLQETVHQRLLECYLATGRRAEGLRAYERCRKGLRQKLRVPPSARTEALKAQLLGAN